MISNNEEVEARDSVVGVRCDAKTRASLKRLAASMDISVSRLVSRMIQRNLRLEEERSVKIKEILSAECEHELDGVDRDSPENSRPAVYRLNDLGAVL